MIYGDHNYQNLIRPSATADGSPQWFPRKTRCGSPEAEAMGLVSVMDFPDDLVEVADFEEIITRCHEQQIFPMYHQAAAGVFEKGWSQDGYGFCWAYGLTASVMGCRALEGKPAIRLAPFSLGWLTGWKNAGFYCDEAIAGARERGIASAEYVPEYDLNPRHFKTGWEQDALNYRPGEWWDTQYQSEIMMIRQCLTILKTGTPLYVAYDWWGHALECVGMRWDERQRNGIIWVLRNSHGESAPIELTETRGVPNEAYGVRAASLSN